MKYFGKGIAVASGFDLNAKAPLDARTVVSTMTALNSMDDIKKYEGLKVFVESEKKNYQFINGTWKLMADEVVNNLTTGGTNKPLSAEQGKILKGQVDSTNSSLSATTGSVNTHKADTNVHVTTADKTKWNDKYTKSESDGRYETKTNVANVSNSRATGVRASVTTPATSGWYRIAQTSASINNCLGNFTVTAAVSGKHSITSLIAGISYGQTPSIIQDSHVEYSVTGISKARIVYHTSYNNNYAYLEVYMPGATATVINVEMYSYVGWSITTPTLQTAIPSGYTTKELTLIKDKIVGNVQGTLTGNASTATKLATARTINGVAFDGSANITITANPNSHTHTKSQITDFPTSMPANGGNSDTVDGKHVNDAVADALWTGTKVTAELNKKAVLAGSSSQDFNAKALTVAGAIMPNATGTLDIGSPTKKFRNIYVQEAHLDANTLYIDGVPVIGSTAETIDIKADPGQGVMVRTTGLGATKIASENNVQITTSGTNADVTLAAGGTGSKVNVTGAQQVNLTAADVNIDGQTTIKKNLVVNGDLTVQGNNTILNTTTLAVEDNIIEVNKGQTGSGVSKGTAGISINRGDAVAQLLVFDEADDKFKVGASNALKPLATEEFVNSGLSGKASSSHTHNYAASTSAGGAANTAVKLHTARTVNGVAFDGTANITVTANPNAHNQASSTITAMTGYVKPSATSAIAVGDTLNAAIGKLEKAIEGKPAGSHNHTSLTGVTSIGFAAGSSDAASIAVTTSGSSTFMDFKLADDPANDWWRWRFAPTGGTGEVDAMILKPISTTASDLLVSGKVLAGGTELSKVGHTHTASQVTGLPTSLPANGGNADTVDGKHAADFALTGHTHTPTQVGLGNVSNWTATSSLTDGSASKYATASAVKALNDTMSKRMDLSGQCQKTSYRRSVIALCNTSAANTSLDSYSVGKLLFHRVNGLSGAVFADIAFECQYGGANKINASILHNSWATPGIRPCTFTYNGKIYGGIEIFFSDAELYRIEFHGASNFGIFALDYDTTNGGGVLNQEVKNSLKFDTVSNTGNLTFNGSRIYHANNKPTSAEIGALSISGGNVTGVITMPSTATSSTSTHPMQIAHGLVGSYGNLKLLANTDNATGADNEYVQIAAARGLTPTVSQGLTVYGTYATSFGSRIVTDGDTATANTVNKIVKRDTSGNFSAGTITASLSGNASSATKWTTARTLTLTGDVTGSVSIDGGANVSITATVADNSHNHTNYAASSHTHNEIKVKDIRDTAPTPNDLSGSRVTTFFNNHSTYGGGWQSGFTVAGWSNDYAVWQMKSFSSNSTSDNRWYLRSGQGATWGSWYEVYHTGRKPTLTELGAAAASHGTHVSYATATTSLTSDMTGAVGSSGNVARQDHTHTITCAAAVGLSNASASAEGSSTSFARADHTHAITGFALSSHNHNSSQVTAMTSYAKASAVSAIAASDTLNIAIGKLEKALDGKQASGSYATASHTHTGYAASSHTHTGYLATSGGTMTGMITTPNGAMGIQFGDDAKMGDVNVANMVGIQGAQVPTNGGIVFGSDKDTNIYRGGANLLKTDDTFQAVGGVKVGNNVTLQYNTSTESLDFVFA